MTDPELRDQLAAAISALGKSETELAHTRADLRLANAMRQRNLDAAAAAIHRADTAEATVARVQALAEEHPAGLDTALILEALDTSREPRP